MKLEEIQVGQILQEVDTVEDDGKVKNLRKIQYKVIKVEKNKVTCEVVPTNGKTLVSHTKPNMPPNKVFTVSKLKSMMLA